ncbi:MULTISPECIES: hypothetical protein [unclassified Streptomyces]|uniref:hypothetical protein n=1 Tax=unclassified Streptomyces TaxID=2593676 RepID=UPI0036F92680
MGSLKVTLCAGAAVCAALTPAAYGALAPAAYAADGGGVSVTPSSPAPGADVSLHVRGCTSGTATAVSAAFVADAHLAGADGTLAGETKVRSSLTPGVYDVKITCADVTVKGRITVVRPGARPTAPATLEPAPSTAAASPLAPASPRVPASPIAPVHAGGGGTARLTAENTARVTAAGTHAEGPGTAHAVMGLVLAGVAAAAVAARGLARRRTH